MSSKKITTESIIVELISAKILFANFFRYCFHAENDIAGKTINLFVNCNDLFAWGCADAEDVPSEEELYNLYDAWKKDKQYGVDFWCCRRRDMQPQKVIKDIWKKNGVWSDELEKLRKNPDEK